MKTLDFKETVLDAIAIGTKNAPSVLAAVCLWVLTIWIPYINIGTTIAISLLPTQLADGKIINPISIFDSQYRRYMGEYILTQAMIFIGILIASIFFIVPGIVLSYAWSLAIFFLIVKGKNPMEAIKASNDATYGSKWTIFAIGLVIGIAYMILSSLINKIFGHFGSIQGFLALIIFVLTYAVQLAVSGSIWKQLRDNVA